MSFVVSRLETAIPDMYMDDVPFGISCHLVTLTLSTHIFESTFRDYIFTDTPPTHQHI